MTTEVFYRKWRPRTFSEVVGQEHITTTLRQSVLQKRAAHAYLFCGPRGTGKTSTARILAKAVNCLEPEEGEPDSTCAICQAISGRTLPKSGRLSRRPLTRGSSCSYCPKCA